MYNLMLCLNENRGKRNLTLSYFHFHFLLFFLLIQKVQRPNSCLYCSIDYQIKFSVRYVEMKQRK